MGPVKGPVRREPEPAGHRGASRPVPRGTMQITNIEEDFDAAFVEVESPAGSDD